MTKQKECQRCKLHNRYGLNLERYGDYRMGLTEEEVREYIRERNGGKLSKGIMSKFNKICGINTVGVGPEGQTLMYRHDVKRFADQLFDGVSTYWD